MSRISKWKFDKTKVKVVFRLQFHATHIPQSGWDKLFISFIPADTGKVTAKTTKANVRNGACKWADPIYETTRLLQDSKSKQYDEKLYKIVVAMGSSRASILGEAALNIADYVDALKPSAVTIPLHGCNFGTILHITIQLLTSKTGFREFEQQRELRETGLQPGVGSHGHITTGKIPYSEEVINDQTDKVSPRIKFKSDGNELSSLEEEPNVNEEYADSATGLDGSSNTSGSLYAEKHEGSSTPDIDSLKSTTSVDPPTAKGEDASHHQNIDNELAIACEENNRLRGSLVVAESSFYNLKLELTSLQSLADDLGAETEKFSRVLSAELSSSQELANEVSFMKSECSSLKDDIIRLKDLKLSPQVPLKETSNNKDIKIRYLNGISFVEDKIRELQKKTYIDGDTKSIYLELEAVLDFLTDFKLRNGEMGLSKENGLGLDLCQPEIILQQFGMTATATVSEVINPAIDAMKAQIFDLVRELDEAKVEKEALTRKMDQMELYYEALIQELEENQKRVIGELQLLTNEHSTCLYTLAARKAEMEDMSQQMLRFVDEKLVLEARNEDLEQRASTSEAALRRARMNYSIAVDKLQKDLVLLSSQVMSVFETNENLIKQALPLQNHENDDNAKKSPQFQRRSVGGDILMGDLKRSFGKQEELYQKVEEELIEMHGLNLNLDIYSKALQESLREANGDIRIMKGKVDELVEELKVSTDSQNQFMTRLQKATDEIHGLSEYKSSSISQFSDMDLRNQLLEDKLVSISDENCLLAQKLKECESKSAATSAENSELSLQLKHVEYENEKLVNEMSLLEEKLTNLNSKSEELISSKEDLKENIGFVRDKLGDLLASHNNDLSANCGNVDIKDMILQLDEIQHNACMKNCELMEENQNLKNERDVADASLRAIRSEIMVMKQKCKSGTQDMASKMAVSNALVEKLQAEFELVAHNLQLSFEIEENYNVQNKVLLADLALLEEQMEELASKNGHLAEEISGLDDVAEVLRRDKLAIDELMHDKLELSCEISRLKDNLVILRNELHEEKVCKDDLEGKVRELMHVKELTNEMSVLEENLDFVREKLMILLVSYSQQFGLFSDCETRDFEGLNVKDAVVRLEEIQHDACIKICKLMEENQNLKNERDTVRSEILAMDQKFKSGVQEIDEKYAEQNKVLLDELALLEEQMEELTCQNSRLAEEISGFDDVAEELARNKLTINELVHDKQELSREISCLKDDLVILHKEKGYKDELAGKVRDLELEKSRLDRLLDQQNVFLEKITRNQESRMLEMHDDSIVSDVKFIYVRIQYEALLEELREMYNSTEANWREEKVNFLKSLDSLRSDLEASVAEKELLSDSNNEIKNQLEECLDKLKTMECRVLMENDLEAKLISSVGQLGEIQKMHDSTEANWREEKVNLSTTLNSLRSDLEASRAEKELLSDSNNQIKNQLEELQKMYNCTEVNWREEKANLLASLDSLRSDLEVSKAENTLLSNSNNEIKNQLEELQEMYNRTEVNWREEKANLLTGLDSLRSDLEASKAENELLSYSNSQIKIQLKELQKMYNCTEVNWREEKANLLASLDSLRSDLEASTAENSLLSNSNNKLKNQLEEHQNKLKTAESRSSVENILEASEEEIDHLIVSKQELEVLVLLLRGKVSEQSKSIAFLEEDKNDISRKLSKQILRTEEYKNLSSHFKELKDKAEAEKRETEVVPSVTVQDSLRIAFIKEQYESKVQELKQKLSVSQKHGEEMLMRLQDSINEIETRKKSEALNSKRNEELSMRLEALEEELETAFVEKREISKAYDRIKAELECALLSLECCKEEKEKLGASLIEFEEEKCRLGGELNSVKDEMENLKLAMSFEKDECEVRRLNGNLSPKFLERDELTYGSENADESRIAQDAEEFRQSNGKNSERLRSSMEHLHEELERMKNENTVFDIGDDAGPGPEVPQREIQQLHKTNEELRSMFPLFNEIPGGGNALERVLALEIELAEALKAKNKSNLQFQSSFLKQHSDEEAVFKSFRDINELIKEMLELKGRHASLEAELRDMHDRYSQLSLQFAEVEGERQKLKMTLKNVRQSKKIVSLNRSSSANVMEHPSS